MGYHSINFMPLLRPFAVWVIMIVHRRVAELLWQPLTRRKINWQHDLRAFAPGLQPPPRCGRRPDEVTLIAISKTHPASVIKRVIELGAADIGENRVQEAEEKIDEIGARGRRWHLVGHLQANKARRAVNLFDVIHSLDSLDLARRLDRLCVEEGREKLPVLIQVDLGHEETKSGIDESELTHLVEGLGPLTRLELIGLMTLPPFFDDPEQSRPFFRRLRELRDELRAWRIWRVEGRAVDGYDSRF